MRSRYSRRLRRQTRSGSSTSCGGVTFDSSLLHQIAREGNTGELEQALQTCVEAINSVDPNGRTLLHVAASANRCDMMECLISRGVDMNATDENGDTALHAAVLNRHVGAARVLLAHGAKDTVLNKQSDAPLHIAARNDHGAMVAAMLEYPVSVTVAGARKRTPLHVAAEYDSVEVLKVLHDSQLIENTHMMCLRICVKDADDQTPIHLAARKASHRALKILIDWGREHGYSMEQVLGFLDEENSTPLHTAVDAGHEEVVKVLLEYGASSTQSKMDKLPPIHLACSQGKLRMVELMVQFGGADVVACKDAFGQTPLHSSTLPPSTAVLSYLINTGAQLNVPNNQGQTPLVTATLSGNLDAVKILLKSGADPSIADQAGENPMHYAVQRSRKAIAKCLLEHPKAPEMLAETNKTGSSPVHFALQQGLSSLVSQMLRLLKESSLHELTNSKGYNYLHLAALGGDWKTVTAILDIPVCQTFLNVANKEGSTPLHLAALGGHLRCVEILLSHGAMAHKCSCGLTPFLLACVKGHSECAKVLYDAHPFQKNWTTDEGNTALHLAAFGGSPACVSFALDIGVSLTYNHKQESFLDIIVNRVDSDCALAVVQHDRWNECLRFKSPIHPYPMLGLVANLPGVAKVVLDRCHERSPLPRDHHDYWESYNFEHLKAHTTVQHVSTKDIEKNESELITTPTDIQENIYTHINNFQAEDSYEILKKMATLKRKALLSHVVVDSYIKQKWKSYGCLIFVTSVFIAFTQMLFLSIFVKISFSESPNTTQNETTDKYLSATSVAIALVTLLLTTIRAIWITLNLVSYGYHSLHLNRNLSMWIGAITVISSYIYLFSAIIKGYNGVILTAGALAVFFGWFGLALELSLFELFGIYVVMFVHVMRTLLLVLALCFLFLLAFGLAFYILGSQDYNFSTIGYSIFTVSSYLLGQMNYGEFILDEDSGYLYNPALVYLLVTFAAIILAIAFNNLLVGLAVGDIGKIQEAALVLRQASYLCTFAHLERAMPRFLKEKYDFIDLKVYPNEKLPFLKQLWRYFWRGISTIAQEDEGINSEGPAEYAPGVSLSQERLLQLSQQMEEMSARQERMFDLIQELHHPRKEKHI